MFALYKEGIIKCYANYKIIYYNFGIYFPK